MRDGPCINKDYNNDNVNNGHVSHMSNGIIIFMTMLLLKTTSNKASLITVERAT